MSEYLESLGTMERMFERVQGRMERYAENYGVRSRVGKHLKSMWLHPKGIINLVKLINMHAERYCPQRARLPLLCTPIKRQSLPQ
jgi:hypothetical protein